MESLVNEQLRREARKFRLRFACEACAHFEPEHGRCAHGYPTACHRERDLEAIQRLTFCKEFELA